MSSMDIRGGLLAPEQESDGEFSDDDNLPLASNVATDEPRMWDVFQNVPYDAGSLSEGSENFAGGLIKFLKLVTYFLVFLVVLGGAGISKTLVLLMTSQLIVDRKVPVCYTIDENNLPQGRDYEAHIPLSENIAWAWVLFFTFIIPEIMTFGRSLRMIVFKSVEFGKVGDVLVVLIFECLHTLGTGLLIYFVLPHMDVVKGAMLTNCVAFIPCFFGMLSRFTEEDGQKDEEEIKQIKNTRLLRVWGDMLALAAQLTGFIVWPLIVWYNDPDNATVWMIPIAIFLISFGWWENYVDRKSTFSLMSSLGEVKDRLYKSRYFVYLLVPFFKCGIFFGCMLLSQWIGPSTKIEDFNQVFNFTRAFGEQRDRINITEIRDNLDGGITGDNVIQSIVASTENSPLYVLAIHACCTWAAYVTGKFACKICIQGFSFALPVNITVPLVISALVSACGSKLSYVCSFTGIDMPKYLFWGCDEENLIQEFLIKDWSWLWLFWVLSQTWITIHVWKPRAKRLASTEQLFVRPMYNALLLDQSLSLNRRRDDQDAEMKIDDIQARVDPNDKEHQEFYEVNDDDSEASEEIVKKEKVKSSDQVIRVYGCATMWHENKDEMLEMLKSLLRMDEDQCARRVAQKYLQVIDPDYYEFETHIFFDDAFEIADENEDENVVNPFVTLLVETIDEAAQYVHSTHIRLRPAKKYPTPYGGRLVWTLPGKTKIVCHLKDKSLIRHKKRWSQCMYMYYLLGFKLMDQPIDSDRKEIIASNTFLLALDGDIDFTPYSVRLLIDLMKKNANLGAACGRIHPVGPGLMVWYQMFEYAIGHWLQKATEHMIGCVLCSPGCFSLFRAKALMDDNVMAKYTTVSSEAMHYVQYDQGEDRWLCTLILQRGYRVEYCAAADSFTNAPTGFNEFFNQRRRWVPSTMANIMDVLSEWRRTIKNNDNISFPYICYQAGLMVGTILGPGTIFLMLVGSFNAAFGISNMVSFGYNLIPIVGFMLSCYFMKSKNQLTVAYLLTALYALVMCIVIVGMMLNFAQEGWNTPTAIFFVATAASFIITGILHPQEFWCLPCGLIYYLLVPSMYLLLILYSVFNLNDVSWGTREVAKKEKKKTREDVEAEKKAVEEAKKQKNREGIMGFLRSSQDKNNDEGSFEFSCAGLFKFMCCVTSRPDVQSVQLARIAESLDGLKRRFEGIENKVGIEPRRRSTISSRRNTVSSRSMSIKGGPALSEPLDEEEIYDEDDESQDTEPREERDLLVNPYWMEDKRLKRGEVDYLPSLEVHFFNDLIETYLKPLEKKPEEQAKVASELKELRDNAVFSFSMMNSIFVIFTFMLQMNKETIHMDWPLGIQANISYIFESSTSASVLVEKKYVQLEPIGFIFVIFFATLLFIQFTGMLFHRFGTFSHILSHTELDICSKKASELTEDDWLDANAVKIAKQMSKLKGVDEDYSNQSAHTNRRMTVHNLERHHQQKTVTGSLDVAFKKRFFSISAEGATNGNLGNGRPSIAGVPVTGAMRRLSMRRGTLQALAQRRESVVGERRASRVAGRSSVSFAADV